MKCCICGEKTSAFSVISKVSATTGYKIEQMLEEMKSKEVY